MLALDITPEEIESGVMRPEHLQAAIQAVHEEGFVVLKKVVSLEHLAILRERVLADVAGILAREDVPFNFNTGNIQQDPPPFPPFLFKDVLLNEMVIAVTKGVLGAGVKNGYYSGNTALKSEQRQPVHGDMTQLWPNLQVAHPAFGLVVNVPLVPMSVENGSTELWPGSHLDSTLPPGHDIKVPLDSLEKRRAKVPPFQPTVPAGSVLIRDIRLWHAGMPNHTDQPRPMIAMIHFISWWNDPGMTIAFPKGTEAFFEHPDLKTSAHFVDEPIDYLKHNNAYDYKKE